MRRKLHALFAILAVASVNAHAWGAQGHRLVALLAANRLAPTARENVRWLLGDETLADVSSWADQYLEGNTQTALWHYLNIPPEATSYDRDRDCPRQPGVTAGSRNDRWRDCAVDRILYSRARLADTSLDRADRAVALKFLVHFVGDLHQPFHALGVERGGNGIPVSAFGSAGFTRPDGSVSPENLHGIWDSVLIAHRGLDDPHYVAALEEEIKQNRWDAVPAGVPAEWAVESFLLAKAALLPPHANVDEAYYRAHISVIDKRLALAGLRLAALLNASLTSAPPVK
jgi:nuclease S1